MSRFASAHDMRYPNPVRAIFIVFKFLSIDISAYLPSLECYLNLNYYVTILSW